MPAPSVEQVIQPLQSPLNQDRVIASITKQPPELSELRWGAVGTLPVPQQVNNGVNFTLIDPYQQTWTETPGTRQTENVQVTSSSDPSQYVTVQRIKGITFAQDSNAQQPQLSFTGFPSTGGSGDGQSVQQTSIPGGGTVQATYNLDNSSYDNNGGGS